MCLWCFEILQADYFSHSQGYAKANPETAQYALKVEN